MSLSLLKRYLRDLTVTVPVLFEKVELTSTIRYCPVCSSSYTLQETWNIKTDRVEKFALLNALDMQSFITPTFPLEKVLVLERF